VARQCCNQWSCLGLDYCGDCIDAFYSGRRDTVSKLERFVGCSSDILYRIELWIAAVSFLTFQQQPMNVSLVWPVIIFYCLSAVSLLATI